MKCPQIEHWSQVKWCFYRGDGVLRSQAGGGGLRQGWGLRLVSQVLTAVSTHAKDRATLATKYFLPSKIEPFKTEWNIPLFSCICQVFCYNEKESQSKWVLSKWGLAQVNNSDKKVANVVTRWTMKNMGESAWESERFLFLVVGVQEQGLLKLGIVVS